MKPIISPLWFYLIGISENLTGITPFFGALGIIAAIILSVCFTCEHDLRSPNEKLIAFYKKNAKRCFIIGLISIFITIITPSEKTCYQMMAANIATPDNIEAVVDTTKDGAEWLIETITEASEKLSDNEKESADE
jgi:hypothetical protein